VRDRDARPRARQDRSKPNTSITKESMDYDPCCHHDAAYCIYMQNVTDVTCQVESSYFECDVRDREETGDCTLVTRLKTRVEAGAERDRSPDPMCELHSLSLFDFEVLIHCASKNTRSARAPDTAVFRYPLPVMFIVGAPSMCALPTAALSLACPPHQNSKRHTSSCGRTASNDNVRTLTCLVTLPPTVRPGA
jgi:hypothetical protein